MNGLQITIWKEIAPCWSQETLIFELFQMMWAPTLDESDVLSLKLFFQLKIIFLWVRVNCFYIDRQFHLLTV